MKIKFAEFALPRSGALVVGVTEGRKLTPSAERVDLRMKRTLSRAIKNSRFKGEKGQFLEVAAPTGLSITRVIAAGLGKANELNALAWESVGGAIVGRVNAAGDRDVAIAVDEITDSPRDGTSAAADVGFGARLGSYRFDRYRTKEPAEKKPTLKMATVMVKDAAKAKRAYGAKDRLADGVFLTRNLVSEPANVIFPKALSERAQALKDLGVNVEALGRERMRELGMNALLGVAQGSANEPQLIVMHYDGSAGAQEQPIAFVGKGVTFDSGGISIKPAQGMEEMKWDMAGAGAVIGTMHALAARKAKVNVVGIAGVVENMPSGTAQRPGDIVRSMSGQTIEVINTDAEGRLVLADALWYTADRFKPRLMVDLATLTGAIIISLGDQYAGLFSNDDDLSEKLTKAGKAVGEELWRFPLSKAYDKLIDSPIADMQNISSGRGAGSITGAQFIQRFVGKVPWAHLDIAGVAWSKNDRPTVPKGGTGFGVRLLDRFVADNFES
ncbi:MAG: leucyl aminopeptidase [Alphaproteobacteria bacterium]|nr:leucyl aminopeptidase [Alphaproteobacteria bacterium]